MSKITEASTLKDLGISSKDVGKLYKKSQMGVKHDLEFEQVTTKGQARSKLKNRFFLVAINDGTGDVAMIYSKAKRYGAGSYYYVTTPTGESQKSSINDVVADLPGKGWKYYASTERYSPAPQRAKKSEEEVRKSDSYELESAVRKNLERIYGKKVKTEISKLESELTKALISFASGTDTRREKDDTYRGDWPSPWLVDSRDVDPDADYMGTMRREIMALRKLADSDRVFDGLGNLFRIGSLDSVIQKHLKDPDDKYSSYRSSSDQNRGAKKYMRNAKQATPKIAQLFFKLLRRYRDEMLELPKGERSEPRKPSLGKVYKAWESYKSTGDVSKLAEALDEGVFGDAIKDKIRQSTGYLPEKEGIIRYAGMKAEDAIRLAQLGIELEGENAVEIFQEIRAELIELKKYLREKKGKK